MCEAVEKYAEKKVAVKVKEERSLMTQIVAALVADKDDDTIIKELNCTLEQIIPLRTVMGKQISKHAYNVDRGIAKQEADDMESYVLNDVEYDFKPLEIFVPDPDYKVDEKELEKSIEKNKAIIARAMGSRKRYLQKV